MGDKAFALNPVGSGPFVVDDWKRGQYLKMSRNPHYWRSGQAVPRRRRVRLHHERQHAHPLAAVGRGRRRREHPVLPGRLAEQGLDAGRDRAARVDRRDLAEQHAQAVRRQARPAGAELRDRQGRDQPRRLLRARRGRGRASSRSSSTRDKSVKNYPYDMDKAKALLAKSSAPKGFDVTILIPSEDQTKAQMMAVVKQLWASSAST